MALLSGYQQCKNQIESTDSSNMRNRWLGMCASKETCSQAVQYCMRVFNEWQ